MAGDREIIEETYSAYSPGLPLDTASIAWGLAIPLVLITVFELLMFALRKLLGIGRHPDDLTDEPLHPQ